MKDYSEPRELYRLKKTAGPKIGQTSAPTPGSSSESKGLQGLESSRWSYGPSKIGNEQRIAGRLQLLPSKKPSPVDDKPRGLMSRPSGIPQISARGKKGPGPYKEPTRENNQAPPYELSQLSADTNSKFQSQDMQTPTVLSQQDFLARVDLVKSEIRTLISSIQEISALHKRALSSPDSSSSGQLEDLVTSTQLKNSQIRDQIKFLEGDAAKTQDGSKSVKSKQTNQLKSEFGKVLNGYRQEELTYQKRYREQIARQYRIVNPEASEAEVEQATSLDWGSEGVFQTVLKGNRSGHATTVLGAVRARHNELQRIEATLTDLVALFADMAQIVETQDPIIENTGQNAMQTTDHIEKANVKIDEANKSAARARKLKWYCLLVGVLIVLTIALGIGLGVGLTKASAKTANNAVNPTS